jgi:hypothetical protein
MSVTDYIHQDWFDAARWLREFLIRPDPDAEPHEPWCGGGGIMSNGRCASCDAMRHPVVHQPFIQRPKVIEAMKAADDFMDEHHRVLHDQQRLQHEMRRKMADQTRRLERLDYETKRLKERVATKCVRCGCMTSNPSKFCHRCKVRADSEAQKLKFLEAHARPNHVAMYTGDGRVVSHGLPPAPSDARMKSCDKCGSAYYETTCPICRIGGITRKILD